MSNILGDPIANPDSVIQGDKYRLTVLTPGLVRLEFSPDGTFEDRASTFAINRNLSKPECRFKHTETGGVELVTQRMRVSYDGKAFTPSGLHVVLIKKSEYILKETQGTCVDEQRMEWWARRNGDMVKPIERTSVGQLGHWMKWMGGVISEPESSQRFVHHSSFSVHADL
jgi:hypothetical protein